MDFGIQNLPLLIATAGLPFALAVAGEAVEELGRYSRTVRFEWVALLCPKGDRE